MQGTEMGQNPEQAVNGSESHMEAGINLQKQKHMSHRAQALEAYRAIMPLLTALRREGLSHAEIARRLRNMGHRTREGGQWSQVQVGRVLRYLTSTIDGSIKP